MRIAVVIPAFNVAPYIGEAIESLIAQTLSEWRAVIVDDGSGDSTVAVAESFHDPRIRIIRQERAGVSAARNRGINTFHSPDADPPDAFLFLDADDHLAPDALARMASGLAGVPAAVACCARYARFGAGETPRLYRAPPRGNVLEKLLIHNRFANGGHVLIRRRALESAGGFNTDLSYGEDWEFFSRLALTGEFIALPGRQPVLYVRERPGSASSSRAADPHAYRTVLAAIHGNPTIRARVGTDRLATLRRRAEPEIAWAVGTELIRRGCSIEGNRWLGRSIRSAPNLKRMALFLGSRLRIGPFRAYPAIDFIS